jgi:RNA polymerase sigma factor (sigma-70 family)
VFDWLRAETRDVELAADLTAETFARALQRYDRLRLEHGDASAAAWLFGIARNVLRETRRDARLGARARQRLSMPTSYEDVFDAVDARLTADVDGDTLAAALGRLPDDQRSTVQLRVVDGLDYDEIAVRLGCTEATARKRVSRALASLHMTLEGQPS